MSLADETTAVRKLLERYYNVPASLADVCLVRMAEIYDRCLVLSLDSDFHIYRRHGRKTIPLSRPDSLWCRGFASATNECRQLAVGRDSAMQRQNHLQRLWQRGNRIDMRFRFGSGTNGAQ